MYSAALLILAGRHFSFSESIHLRIRHFVTVTLICFGHLFDDFSPAYRPLIRVGQTGENTHLNFMDKLPENWEKASLVRKNGVLVRYVSIFGLFRVILVVEIKDHS